MLKVSQFHGERSVTCNLKVWTVPYNRKLPHMHVYVFSRYQNLVTVGPL